MSIDNSFPVFEPPSWVFGHFVAQPYSGKVTNAHSSIFRGSRDTGANVAWGVILPPPPGGYIRANFVARA